MPRTFSIIMLFLAVSIAATASGANPPFGKEQTQKLTYLFKDPPTIANYAPHTFVFFLQGAQLNLVYQQGKSGRTEEGLYLDQVDAQKIQNLAKTCSSCNVIVLHVQRFGARFWMWDKERYATKLQVFTRGKKILDKKVDVLNGADPRVVANLLVKTREWFPESGSHFIYRGHGFHPGYVPAKSSSMRDLILSQPFDRNFDEFPYNVKIFARGFASALQYLSLRQALALESVVESKAIKEPLVCDDARNTFLQNLREKLIIMQADIPKRRREDFGFMYQGTLQTMERIRNKLAPLSHTSLMEVKKDLQTLRKTLLYRFSSLTFAACEMDVPMVKKSLWPYVNHLVASAAKVNPSLKKGISYRFIVDVQEKDSESKVAEIIRATVFERALKISREEKISETVNALLD